MSLINFARFTFGLAEHMRKLVFLFLLHLAGSIPARLEWKGRDYNFGDGTEAILIFHLLDCH